MASEEQHAVAVIAALNAAGANPFDLDDIKKKLLEPGKYGALPPYYTEVTVTRRSGGARRQSGHLGSTVRRIGVRAVADTVTNARLIRRKQEQALEYARLVIDGRVSGQVQFETAEDIAEDNGSYSGLALYNYAFMEA